MFVCARARARARTREGGIRGLPKAVTSSKLRTSQLLCQGECNPISGHKKPSNVVRGHSDVANGIAIIWGFREKGKEKKKKKVLSLGFTDLFLDYCVKLCQYSRFILFYDGLGMLSIYTRM